MDLRNITIQELEVGRDFIIDRIDVLKFKCEKVNDIDKVEIQKIIDDWKSKLDCLTDQIERKIDLLNSAQIDLL